MASLYGPRCIETIMESCPWVLLEVSMRRRFHEKTGHGFDGIAKEILTIVSQYRKISCYLEYS